MSEAETMQSKVLKAYCKYNELEENNEKNIIKELDGNDFKFLTGIFKLNMPSCNIEECFGKWYLANSSEEKIKNDCRNLSKTDITDKNVKRIYKIYRKYYNKKNLMKEDFKCFLKNEFGVNIDIKNGGWCHYWNVIRLFKMTEYFVDFTGNESGDSKIRKEQFEILKNSGLIFQKPVYSLLKCALTDCGKFVKVMKVCFDKWDEFNVTGNVTGGRTKLEKYFESELADVKKRQDAHENLVKLGKVYLKTEKECYTIIPTREPYYTANGEKIVIEMDLNGWSKDGSIYGIDAKTSVQDMQNFLRKDKYKKYSKFCNKFYILTDNQRVVEVVKKSKKIYKNKIGVLFCDLKDNIEEEKEPENREITHEMRTYIEKHFKNDICSRLQKVTLDDLDNWEVAIKELENEIRQF